MEFYDFDEIEVDMSIMCLTVIKSETGPTMNAHGFINYELKFHLKKFLHTYWGGKYKFDEIDDAVLNAPIEEAHNVQISDVVIDGV